MMLDAKQTQAAYQEYTSRWGTLAPERSITEEQFRQRLDAFASVIDPWVTGEGSKEAAVRRFAKAIGVKTSVGRVVFHALFTVIDKQSPVS